MSERFHLSFAPGVELLEEPAGQWVVGDAQVRIPLPEKKGILEAAHKLARGGASEKALIDLAERSSKQAKGKAATQMLLLLFAFSQEGLLCRAVMSRGKPFVTSVPLGAQGEFVSGEISRESRFVLSRFAWCRRDGDRIVLESPLGAARVILHGERGVWLVSKLARPCRACDLSGAEGGSPARAALGVLELLWNAGALSPVDEHGVAEEETRGALLAWEFHDLLFHSRSRQGRHAQGYGGTDRLKDRLAPLPAVKPAMSADAVELRKADIAAIERSDPAFTHVLEARRSSRRQGEPPITLEQLGEFLYRTARVRGTKVVDGEEYSERVYPSAGGAYELEFYLVVDRCAGLSSGLYHYQPAEHRLYRLAGGEEEVERLLESAARTARSEKPQVLVVLAARFGRLMRRYEARALGSVPQSRGVGFQTV